MDAAGASPEEGAAQRETRSARPSTYSGRLLLRMPESLHQALVRRSEAEHVSLNAFINDALEKTVHPGGTSSSSSAKSTSMGRNRAQPERSATIGRLLVANLIVVTVVGILAIVLLVRALT